MASMMKEQSFTETTFSVRTDTDNDALLVPEGIETVLVNDTAHRVIIPEGVEVVRLQTSKSSSHTAPRPPAVQDESTDTPPWLLEPVGAGSRSPEPTEPVERVKRETLMEAAMAPRTAAAPPREVEAERSLSLPSVPGSPPTSPEEEAILPPRAPLARDDEPDPFDDVPLRPPPADPALGQRVVRDQPGRNGSARRAQPLRQPLVSHGHSHVMHGHSHVVQPNWREQFQLEHEHSRPVTRQAGRFCADVLCCWLGV